MWLFSFSEALRPLPLFKCHHLRKTLDSVPLPNPPNSPPSGSLCPQGRLCVLPKMFSLCICAHPASVSHQSEAYSPLLEHNTEGPLYPVAGHTSVRSGLVITEHSGEGEGSQDQKSWRVSRARQVKLSSVMPRPRNSGPHITHNASRLLLQSLKKEPCRRHPRPWKGLHELSGYLWPARVERHKFFANQSQ